MRLVIDRETQAGTARFPGAAQSAIQKPHRKTRVLVTDDDAGIRVFLKVLLECEGFEVLEATNGRQAVELAQREKPDLLITDLDMPQVDGYMAIVELRRDASLAAMPILVHSGENGPGVEQLVLELGADDFIPKSFDPATIVSRVHMALRPAAIAA